MDNNSYEAFLQLYNEKFIPILKRLDADRVVLEASNRMHLLVAMSVIIFAALSLPIIYIYAIRHEISQIVIVASIAVAIVLLYTIGIRVLGYFVNKNSAKELKIRNKILSMFGDFYYSEVQDKQVTETVKNFGLTPQKSRKSKFTVIGRYNDVSLTMHACPIQREVSAGKYVFDGIIIRFKMDDDFKGTTVVARNNHVNSAIFNMKFVKVEVPDDSFMRKRTVYASDKKQALSLLKPELIEQIAHLETEALYGAESVTDLIFCADSIYLILGASKAIFDVDFTKSFIDNPEQFWTVYNKLNALFSLVNYFKQNLEFVE